MCQCCVCVWAFVYVACVYVHGCVIHASSYHIVCEHSFCPKMKFPLYKRLMLLIFWSDIVVFSVLFTQIEHALLMILTTEQPLWQTFNLNMACHQSVRLSLLTVTLFQEMGSFYGLDDVHTLYDNTTCADTHTCNTNTLKWHTYPHFILVIWSLAGEKQRYIILNSFGVEEKLHDLSYRLCSVLTPHMLECMQKEIALKSCRLCADTTVWFFSLS